MSEVCVLNQNAQRLLYTAMDRPGLSTRAYHRILKVARKIADPAGGGDVTIAHVSEAVGYRVLDRHQS